MHYLWKHISDILHIYDGKLPLAHWLKQYFRQHPKLGSRDRRAISDAIYAWYRCSKALPDDASLNDKVYSALFMCGLAPKGLERGAPDYYHGTRLPLGERLHILTEYGNGIEVNLPDIFPYPIDISDGITKDQWISSLLVQPRLFLRTRRRREQIDALLSGAEVEHEWIADCCLALPNGTDVESILPADSYWIMDASSQRTGEYFNAHGNETWWDCCSGAGGKSLLLKQQKSNVQLTVSDVRESILQNLSQRFRQYNMEQPERIVLDVADGKAVAARLRNRTFDAILCDAPCTGSGTWARTPEGAYFFNPDQLSHYTSRQEAILTNACDYIREGGKVIYITCSVFRAENEDILTRVSTEKGLQIEQSTLINGTNINADCLFVGVLRKG